MSVPSTHNVLQLHGGGTLVISAIIKCAILEKMTGRRINDLFQTTICDSGGAIARLCLERMTGEELLKSFIDIVKDTFPSKKFYYTQLLPRTKRRFDNSALHTHLHRILGDSTLEDFKGNLFVGAHNNNGEGGATTFEKYTASPDAETNYRYAVRKSKLFRIAINTSTIPGIHNEEAEYDDSEEDNSDELHLDSIVNQNPAAILAQIKGDQKKPDIFFLQMGNIQDKGIVNTLLNRSAMLSRALNLHWKYAVHHLHSAHINDAKRVIGQKNATSFITYGTGQFSPSDPSLDQMNKIILETLADIEKRGVEYQSVSRRIAGQSHLAMPLDQALKELKATLDPFMKKKTILLSRREPIPDTFPTPHIQWADDVFTYKRGYAVGQFISENAPAISRYLIESDFNLAGAFKLAYKSGVRKLVPTPPNNIEPK